MKRDSLTVGTIVMDTTKMCATISKESRWTKQSYNPQRYEIFYVLQVNGMTCMAVQIAISDEW